MKEIIITEKEKEKEVNLIKAKNNNIKIKNRFVFDIGLAVLRPILSFLVIMTHCYKLKSKKGLWKSISKRTKRFFFHVPIFFLMSFYFSQRSLSLQKSSKDLKDYVCLIFFGL